VFTQERRSWPRLLFLAGCGSGSDKYDHQRSERVGALLFTNSNGGWKSISHAWYQLSGLSSYQQRSDGLYHF
jgi:hypothetical protein